MRPCLNSPSKLQPTIPAPPMASWYARRAGSRGGYGGEDKGRAFPPTGGSILIEVDLGRRPGSSPDGTFLLPSRLHNVLGSRPLPRIGL